MTYKLLFDLDDTLLHTNVESFIPEYFRALSDHLSSYVSSDVFLPAIVSGMRSMMETNDPSLTMENAFDKQFYGRIGVSKAEISARVNDFYDNVFPTLNKATEPRPEAVPLIEWAISKGFRIAVATDPLFPRKATHHRLRWAGFDPAQFELVSTFEDFHFSKTYPAYYAEVLGRLGWPDGPVIMVGNDIQRDLVAADRLGLKTFLVDGESASSPGPEAGRGKLADFRPWLESQDPSAMEPSYKSPEAVMAIISSTPAVLTSLTDPLRDEQWTNAPSPDDWTINEAVCHLRDSDIEIHALQLQLMLEKADAFIPRPDSSIWANEREYLHVNGRDRLQEFTSARIKNIEAIKNTDESIWSRKARHAIFGPTNFTEVIGFIADHDRAHVQQVWKTMNTICRERV